MEGYIDANPIRGKIERPASESRGNDCRLSETTVHLLLSACRHECQRQLLTGLFQSGGRGRAEIVGLEAQHFEQRRFWRVWGKGTKRTPTGVPGSLPNAAAYRVDGKNWPINIPPAHLFRNTHGTAWTEDTIRDLFRTIREQLRKRGRRRPPVGGIPYSSKHTFTTNRLSDWGNTAKSGTPARKHASDG